MYNEKQRCCLELGTGGRGPRKHVVSVACLLLIRVELACQDGSSKASVLARLTCAQYLLKLFSQECLNFMISIIHKSSNLQGCRFHTKAKVVHAEVLKHVASLII